VIVIGFSLKTAMSPDRHPVEAQRHSDFYIQWWIS
jgi:hypothetical protein